MPLSAPAEREELHQRRYDFRGFRRADGLWDVEGWIADTKSYGFSNYDRAYVAAGEPLHEMAVRITLDEDFVVRDIEATTEASPFTVCPAIAQNYRKLIGARMGTGWRRTVRNAVGGTEGCTHITELIGALATVAFQTMYPILAAEGKVKQSGGQRPPLLDSCYAFRSDGPIVAREYPAYYTGPSEAAGEG